MRSVNLIPAYRIESRRREARVKRWAMACTIYGSALACVWVGSQIVWPDARTAVASDVAHLEKQAQEDRSAAKALHPRLAEAQTTLSAAHSIGDQPDWSHLMALTAELLGDDAVLRLCRLEPITDSRVDDKAASDVAHIARYRFQIEGFGRSQAAVLGYVHELEKTGLFDSVTLIETRGEAFHDAQAIAFQIVCVLSDREGALP